MRELISRLVRDDEGQDLVEYVLLIALIGLAVAGFMPAVVTAINGVFTRVSDALS